MGYNRPRHGKPSLGQKVSVNAAGAAVGSASAIAVGAVALSGLGGGVANAATLPATSYSALVGHTAIAVSANDGGSAVANAADTLSLTVGSPSSSAFAQAVVNLPAGSVLPKTAPTFTTDHFSTGSPRWVIVLANGNELMNNQLSSTVSYAGDATAADWSVNTSTGWSNTLYTYADAVTAVGGPGQVVKSAYIVADGDQAAGTTDTISAVQYGGAKMTVKPVKPVSNAPVLSKGHAVAVTPNRENVIFTSNKTGWVHFQISGPGAINGHEGWVHVTAGVNAGVYTGLNGNHHGYAVYFTPVAAQGSTTPTGPTGHVYFVTKPGA